MLAKLSSAWSHDRGGRQAVALGWPGVQPVISELLEWIQNYNWPVAHTLATVHAVEIGPAIAAKLREALPSPALTVTAGDFEQIDVGEDRFDALFSATAAT